MGLIGKPFKSYFFFEQYGKFYKDQNSFEIIGCHALSVYFYFFNNYRTRDLEFNILSNKDPKRQIIEVNNKTHYSKFEINISCSNRSRFFEIIGDKGVFKFSPLEYNTVEFYQKKQGISILKKSLHFDEKNNLKNSINNFVENLKIMSIELQEIVIKTSFVLNKINDYSR